MKLGLIERFPIGVYPKIGSSWLKGAAHWGENRIFFLERERKHSWDKEIYSKEDESDSVCVFLVRVFLSNFNYCV